MILKDRTNGRRIAVATVVGAIFLGLLLGRGVAPSTSASLAATPNVVAEESRGAPPSGSLVIIGGCERFDNQIIWSTIVELAGGSGAKIAVFPTASGFPVEYGNDICRVLNDAGADAFTVPVALSGFAVDHRQAVHDQELVEKVRSAGGVFFVGGEQARIRKALVDDDGRKTPMLEAIWEVYREGGVIAGTSAGAAIMSRVMFRYGRSVLSNLQNGVAMGKEIDHGLGFLNHDWFVDQHCLVRGRFARALVAMHSQGFHYGIGVDEDSAVVVRANQARVIGYRGAIVLDLSEASSDADNDRFNLKNAKISYLDRGDAIDLETLEVTPAPEKLGDRKVDPNAEDFRPAFRHRVFCNDILGNTAVLDTMCQMLDNRHAEGFGLAFDGAAARNGPTDAFEFRFYRDNDTVGWQTESFGGDDYTIVNLHLDISPIKLTGPLYVKD